MKTITVNEPINCPYRERISYRIKGMVDEYYTYVCNWDHTIHEFKICINDSKFPEWCKCGEYE